MSLVGYDYLVLRAAFIIRVCSTNLQNSKKKKRTDGRKTLASHVVVKFSNIGLFIQLGIFVSFSIFYYRYRTTLSMEDWQPHPLDVLSAGRVEYIHTPTYR